MGKIIDSKIFSNNKIIYRILLEKDEILSLKNAIRNINLFSANLCDKDAKIIKRGKEGVTQYFEIPFNLRFRKKKEYENLYYQKLETATKIYYLYVVKKNYLK
jgi:hypothetical protein